MSQDDVNRVTDTVNTCSTGLAKISAELVKEDGMSVYLSLLSREIADALNRFLVRVMTR